MDQYLFSPLPCMATVRTQMYKDNSFVKMQAVDLRKTGRVVKDLTTEKCRSNACRDRSRPFPTKNRCKGRTNRKIY